MYAGTQLTNKAEHKRMLEINAWRKLLSPSAIYVNKNHNANLLEMCVVDSRCSVIAALSSLVVSGLRCCLRIFEEPQACLGLTKILQVRMGIGTNALKMLLVENTHTHSYSRI
jgi:hypothetical protein